MSKPNVLVIQQAAFDPFRFDGYRPGRIDDLVEALATNGTFTPRGSVDPPKGSDPDAVAWSLLWKQICTYGLVRFDGGVLCYTRKTDHDRPDLARVDSIGVGGHVDAMDVPTDGRHWWEDPAGMIADAILREVREEIPGARFVEPKILGLVNQDEGAGVCHLGVVYETTILGPYLPRFSEELCGAGFPGAHQIVEERLEPWSKILARALVCTPEQVKASADAEYRSCLAGIAARR